MIKEVQIAVFNGDLIVCDIVITMNHQSKLITMNHHQLLLTYW